MKRIKFLFLLLLSLIIISCSGVKFANSPVNSPLPDSFTKRALYPGGVAGYEFNDLVGNIIKLEPNHDPLRMGVIVPEGFRNEIIPIVEAESNNYFKSRIQRGAEINGSYLAFAANFSVDQLAELELIDIARAGISFVNPATYNEIEKALTDYVKNHPKQQGDTSKRIWIKSVVLTRQVYHTFTNVGAHASGVVGEVVGVSTGVYNKNDLSTRSVIIAFESFDIDELVSQIKNDIKLSLSAEDKLNNALFKEVIKGEIKKQ